MGSGVDHAIELAVEARDAGRGLSIGLLGNAAEVLPELLERHLSRAERGEGLTNDPGMGVIRHVDAGYDRAMEVADERGVRVPMRQGPRLEVEDPAVTE